MKSTPYGLGTGGRSLVLRLAPVWSILLVAGSVFAGQSPENPLPFRQVTWIESRVSDFTDGQLDPCLYVSNRAHLEPTPGCVEFFTRFDVDNNGYYDLACSDDSGPNLTLYLGSDSGYYPQNRRQYPTTAGGNVELADLNLDGYAELIHSGWREGRVNIYWGTPEGPSQTDTTSLTYGGQGEDVCVYDLDRDGYLDIILGSSNGLLYIFWGSASGYSSGTVTTVNIGYSIGHNIEVADLDKDGWADIALSCWTYNQCPIVYWGPGRTPRTTVWLPFRWKNAHGVALADLNKDGWLDIVYTGYDTVVSSFVYFGSATGFSVANRTEIHPGQCYGGSRIADFNGDGWLDIVYLRGNWIYGNRSKPVIYYNTGSGTYFVDANCEEIGSDSLNASGGFIADLNDDDVLDIFVNNMEPNDSSYILWGAGHGGHTALPANNDHHGVFREPGNFYDRGYYAYYTSSVFAAAPNGDSAITSGSMSWVADLPPWSSLFMAVRAGNSATPDASWIGFQDVGSSGSNLPDSIKGRKYLQYRAKLVYSRPCYLPSLEKVDCLLNLSPRHDVSVLAIVAPPDTVDSGAVVTPRAALVNYGGFRETTLVRLHIGGSYADSVTRILAPYQNDTVNFRTWNANLLGWFPMKCSSATRNDVEPTNDFVTDSCLVRVFTDAAAESILAPRGSFDSGATVTPVARIRNLSAHAVAVPAYFTITGGYAQARSKLLAAGAVDTVQFPNWTASLIGNLTARCSTGLAKDEQPRNDTVSVALTVGPRIDAAAIAILAPLGVLDSGAVVVPSCRISNLSTRAESIPVRLQIGAGYQQFAGKVLGPGATDTVVFPSWTASPLGAIAVRCSTALPLDQHNENDTVSSSVLVRAGIDAASVQILSPLGFVDSGSTVTPIVRIANLGTRSTTIPVQLTVGSTYSDARSKTLAADGSDTVVFSDWQALQLGTFLVKCTTQLTGDQHPENDRITDSVTVQTRLDASADLIQAPTGTVDSGQTIIPVVQITNRSTRALTIPVNLRITDGYSAARSKLLAIGASDTVHFAAWTATRLGSFVVKCSTALVGDMNPVNDTVSGSVTVRAGIDAASVTIVAPAGTLDSGTTATPVVRIANNGTRNALIPVRLRIGSGYDTTITKALACGTSDTVGFPVWVASQLGTFPVRCSTGLSGDQHPENDTLSSLVSVQAHIDAAALTIIAPTGVVDSGVSIVPVARIANHSTRTELIPAKLRIGATYLESLSKLLAPGAIDTISFPAYQALYPGWQTVRCTVGLAGDQVPGNNVVTDSLLVLVHLDVGVTQILAPIGNTDSGTVITPRALVHNYGTRSLPTPVRLRIGGTYNQQVSQFIAAGMTDTASFPTWTASPLGVLPVRCSTELTGDENTANDARTDSVTVGVRIDAASVAILAPLGTVDSGAVAVPVVRIANYGTRSAAIPVTLKIGTLYQKNRTKTIPAGATDTMDFASWTASELGINAIRCSTGLASDRDHSNDTISSTVTVRARIDAASVTIVAPTGTVDSGAVVTPIIRIANNGSHTELIPVRLRIGSGYDTTASKQLLPGTQDTVSFPTWTATAPGANAVRCSTGLAGDQNPVNDTLSNSVTVRLRVDAASIAIIAPLGLIDSGSTVTPIARIQNLGARAAMIPVTLTIGSGYADTKTRILAAGVADTIMFANWQATQLGTQVIKCTTQLTGDQHPENDRVIDSCIVRARLDASADLIQAPTGTIDSGQIVVPIVQITNRSTRALTIPVNLLISDGYSAARSKLLAIGASDTVQFAAWTATQLGSFTVKCSTALAGDVNPANDTVSSSVTVRAVVDAASVAILAPTGIVDSGATVTPTVRISNNGTRNELVPIRLRIGSGYDTTRTKLLVHGIQDTVLFPVWIASQLGTFPIRCSTGLSGDQHPENDTLSSSITVQARIDAAALAIIAPTGTLDSGTTVIPVARISNLSTRTELIPVRFQIGSVYAESTTKSLAPGVIDTVAFPAYTALAPARYTVRCTVGLVGDQVPGNNVVTDSLLVLVHLDVGVAQILAPVGNTDSGTVITPRALVYNYGTRSLIAPVRMRIGFSYDRQESLFLSAGTADTITFPDWTASPLGILAVKCSTSLTGDENAANDARTDSVTVGARFDAASITVIVPTGTVDSGAMVVPLVRIANFGTRSASIPVTLRIGSTYQRTRIKTFPAGVTDTMSLPFWTATELGVNAIRCSTGLANDRDHSNDTISSTVLVRALIDAAPVAIIVPTGTVDSGTSVTPVIRIANNGSRTELIPVRLRIGSGYDTSATKQLLPGTQDTVSFPTWTATVPGVNAVRCSTGLAGDQNPANDTLSSSVTVRTLIDAAVQVIVSPTGILDSGATVTPVVRIANNGTSTALIPARLRIGSFYDQTQSKLLAPGTSDTVVFPDWNALQVGTHVVRCSLMLAGDEVPANDTLSSSVTVRTRIDAASIAIIAPLGTLDSGTTITPIARIQNLGYRAALIPVTLTIGSGYADTKSRILQPGVTDTIAFADWQATRLGAQIIKCTTQLADDQHPENDRVIDSCVVRARLDASADLIQAPTGTVDSGQTIIPIVRITNRSTRALTIPVNLRITDGYSASRSKLLGIGASDTVHFATWTATQLGSFTVKCSTALIGDMNPVNDTVSGSVAVRAVVDAASIAIVAPIGIVDSGNAVAPILRISNNGTRNEMVPVRLRIGSGYDTTRTKLLVHGTQDTVLFPVWTASQLGSFPIRCSTGLIGDQHPENDTLSSSVTVQARIDAAALAILAPVGTLDSGTTVIPVARISNLSTRTELIPVRFQIGSVYAESTTKLLAPGIADTVSFPVYTALVPARYTVRCTVGLSGDQVPGNNVATDSFLVRVHLDVGVTSILVPTGAVDSGTMLVPRALVHNYGTRSLTAPVRMKVGGTYNQQVSQFIAAGMTDTISFPNWTASPVGVLAVRCSTELAGDENTGNDRKIDSVIVGVRIDAASVAIVAPTGTVDSGTVVAPLVRIANYGTRSAAIPVTLRIGTLYQKNRTKTIPAGASDTMNFALWTANELGINVIRCSTGLANDRDHSNDAISSTVVVRARVDAAALAIVSPAGTIDSGSAIAPVVRIANNGTRQEAVPVFVHIGADYADSTIKVLSPGTNDTVVLTPWVASHLGTASVRCSVGLANDQNPANDTISSSVTVQARIDAAALAIIAPTGTLDSGTTVIPVARISNLSTRTELIPVRFQIGSVYAESTTKLLAPGVIDTVSFPDYTALAPARYTVRCTVGLVGDQVPGNNVVTDSLLVLVHLDVGVAQILAPVGNTDSGTVITPRALVYNYGTRSLIAPVRMRIGFSYDQQESLFLSAGTADTITFPDWTASPLGVLTVKCSTELTGDENASNDARIDSVIVGVRIDAASVAIIAPTGTVDSGTVVTPLVRIANYGTRSAAIPVTLKIGTLYQKSRTKTIPAGAMDTMNFALWTANELGVNVIRCSTGLSGDRNPANDTCSGQVEVATRVDAGVTAIIAPVGTLDSGSAVTPAVRIANLGTRPADVPVRLTIGSLYDQTVTRYLDIGATEIVEFPDWTATEVGALAVRCSLELEGDQVSINDTLSGVVTVLTRIDAAALAIIAPAGTVDSGSVVTPVVRIANNGTSAALIPARLTIDSFYDQTQSKLLAPGANDTVVFPDWSAAEVGAHVVRCSVMLASDEVPANDTISTTVTVSVRIDAASIAIVAPAGTLDSGTTLTPVARIANLGVRPATIPVTLTIDSGYTDTRTKTLDPGATDTVAFADWQATSLGWHAVRCTVALDGDQFPGNDAIQDSVLVGARLDAQAIAILAPAGSADSGDVITPIVQVRNNSTRSLWIPVRLKIGSDYNRFRNKWLVAGAEDTVRFAAWTASPLGTIAVRCSTYLFGDQNQSNDTLSDSIVVGARVDAAAQMIIAPLGIVDSGASVTPVAQVANLGTRREAIPVFLTIGTTYAESAVRFLDPGAFGTVNFPLWTADELGLFPVRCSVALATDRQPANDTVSGSVKVKAVIDAGIITIIAPRGDVDSGTAILPRVLVANLGTRTEAIPARLTIGSFYAESTLRILMPGRQDTVRFPQFVAEQFGTYMVRCSLSLTDDQNLSNDTASAELRIRPRIDAAPTAIIAPLGSVDSGTVVTPKALVTNYGAHTELIPVRLDIGSGYTDSMFRLLAPGACDTVRFAPWTATEVGMNAIRCTTTLALDQHPENDLLVDSVAVGVLTDAGAVQLFAPTGLIDSGTTVTPRALVRNFGSRPASIPVMMRIGTGYEQRVTRTIPAGRSVTVVFPSWIAQPLGTQAVKCSTALDNDRNPDNDAVSDSVTVRFYQDVAAVRIIAPTGICDSGTIKTPCAIVANYGMEPAKLPVFFRIENRNSEIGLYSESLVVRLAAGAEDTVRFPDWPADELGTFAVMCSVALSGDRNPDNDCLRDSVLVRPSIDAASIMILAPVGTVDSGATIRPQALVANDGTRTELVPVLLTIGSDYADSVFRLMAPGTSDTVTFKAWTAGAMRARKSDRSDGSDKSGILRRSLAPGVSRHLLPRSLVLVRCSTGLAGDQYPVNDTVSALVGIGVHRDAAVLSIIAPAGEIDSGTVLAPSAVIANLGTSAASIPVTMRIGSTYLQTVSRFVLPQQTDTAVFPLWIALQRDTNFAECSVALAGDTNPANNQVADTFDVRVQDVGAIALLAPPGRVSAGDTFVPRARVLNFGNRTATFPARFRIESGSRTGLTGRTGRTLKVPVFSYSDSSLVTDLAPGASAEVSFAPWIAQPGTNAMSCSTEYALDLNPFNDKIADSVNSAPRNLLLVPDTFCITQPNTTVEYRLRLTNLGNNLDTVDISYFGLHADWRLELTDTLRRPLTDHNGNSLPDVGELRAHDTCTFLARITVPADAPAHTVDLTRVKAQSGRDSLVWDQVQLQTEIGSASHITIEPSQQDTTGPGVPVSYTLYVHNYGNAADIADLGLVHAQSGWQYEMLDRDGNPLPDRNGNGMPEIGPIAPFGTETEFELRVTPAANARAGLEDSLIIQAFSTNSLDLYQDEVTINTCVSPALSSLVVEADQQDNVRPGDVSYYALWAEIQGNIDDIVELTVSASQPGWEVGVLEPDRRSRLTDTDSDSLIDLGLLTCGQPRRFVLRVAAPEHANLNGSPDSFAALRVTITGTSAQFPNLRDSAVVLVTLIPNVSAHTYPNPAEDHTAFVFGLPEPGRVSITLYDRASTLVYKLLDGAQFNQGPQTVNWNMHNRANRTIAPGTYYYVFDFLPDNGSAERVLGKLVKR